MTKIGIIGSGIVGQTLANGFLKHGYTVMMGTRNVEKLALWHAQNPRIQVGTFDQTAYFGDILVLATKGKPALEVLGMCGTQHLDHKILIDVTNPIEDGQPAENGVLHFFTTLEESLMEQLQAAFPNVKFVKAFNSIGSGLMVNPDFGDQKPTMFICGNHEEAKKEVKKIVELFGFEVEDMGKATAARAIEPLCMLWCIPGFLKNEWNHGFKLLKK